MFCNSKNDPNEKNPNVNICPICMGHPGTMPTINREAVRHVLRVGLAVRGELADFTEFDRKNYFYPDIPKGYQISQYKYPLVSHGELAGVKLTRIHLEEDTARSSHDTGSYSLVDFNRAGVPLMELVTEPVIHSSDEAVKFAKELQLLLIYLGASEANMEKGEMRVEANISVSEKSKVESEKLGLNQDEVLVDRTGLSSKPVLGTKVEVKNLNSFRAAGKAIEYEIERQIGLLESGGVVSQETRGWDEKSEKTFSQRSKEESHDYRYFPEPDLPKLKIGEISEFSIANLEKDLPELPEARRARYLNDFNLKPDDIEMLVGDFSLAEFFEGSAKLLNNDKVKVGLLANYLLSDLVGLVKKNGGEIADIIATTSKISPQTIAQLIELIAAQKISSRGAKEILSVMLETGGEPAEIAKSQNLFQQSDAGAIEKIAKSVIDANPNVVSEYKSGKASALQFLIGQAMKASRGSANPKVLTETISRLLS